MKEQKPRLAGVLVGDIHKDPGARIKYGGFFAALAERLPLVEVYDASLQGWLRYWNALLTFSPNPDRWRERFYKNVRAFRLRSYRTNRHFQRRRESIDAIVQVGVLLNARWQESAPPSVIYTDYTARLAAQIPAAGRSPFSPQQRQTWLALEREALAQASHICTRSAMVRDSLVHDYGMTPERVTVIGGGINFTPLPAPVEHREKEHPTALFIGKELYRKGGDVLLLAFAEARKVVPGARLILLTSGPIPPHLPQAGVEVVRPTWDRQVIADLYRRADLFVLPSRLETWGDVLLEAMSYGLPCIGVTGQSMEEIIEHNATGCLVPPGDVSALVEALVCLFAKAELRQRWGHRGRVQAETRYQWTDVVTRLETCIKQAIGNNDHTI